MFSLYKKKQHPRLQDSSFRQLTAALNQNLDLPNLAQQFLDLSVGILGSVGGFLLMPDGHKQYLEIFANSEVGPMFEAKKKSAFNIGQVRFWLQQANHPLTQAFQNAQVQNSDFLTDFFEPAIEPTVAKTLSKELLANTWIASPLLSRGGIVGISLFGFKQKQLSKTLASRLETFNQLFATAIATSLTQADAHQHKLHLREAMANVQSIKKMKEDLLSLAAHELRTPLAAMKLMLTLLQRDDELQKVLSEDHRRFFNGMYGEALRLEDIVNNIYRTLEIVSGHVELRAAPIAVDLLLRDVIKQKRLESFEQQIEIVYINLSNRPLTSILGDRDKLRHVFWELIHNAVKHGKPGITIRVMVNLVAVGDNDFVEIKIADNGRGLPEGLQEMLFKDYFTFGGAILNKHIPGMGLGLYIVQKMVELHHGSIEVESAPGEGTLFRLRFPMMELGHELTLVR